MRFFGPFWEKAGSAKVPTANTMNDPTAAMVFITLSPLSANPRLMT
jgi:hypothetical protein